MDEDVRVCVKEIRVLVDDLQKSVAAVPLHTLTRKEEWDSLLTKVFERQSMRERERKKEVIGRM